MDHVIGVTVFAGLIIGALAIIALISGAVVVLGPLVAS